MSISLEKIMPHKAPMLLIEKIISDHPDNFTVGLNIHEKTFGLEDGAVPGWFGMEYMAQTIAAYNGFLSSGSGGKVEIGFLVGVREYKTTAEKFNLGDNLEISISPSFVVNNAGSFDCKILKQNAVIAEAILTTYKPDQNFIDNLKGQKS